MNPHIDVATLRKKEKRQAFFYQTGIYLLPLVSYQLHG
jgi:hypothetical protein